MPLRVGWVSLCRASALQVATLLTDARMEVRAHTLIEIAIDWPLGSLTLLRKTLLSLTYTDSELCSVPGYESHVPLS
jgi:hypothetical protein